MLASRNGPSYRAATAVDTVNSAAIHERIHSVHCTAVQLYSYGVLRSTAVVPKEIGLQLRESLAPTGTRSYGYPPSPTGTHCYKLYGNTVPVVYSTASILYVVDLLPVQCNLTIAWRCCMQQQQQQQQQQQLSLIHI